MVVLVVVVVVVVVAARAAAAAAPTTNHVLLNVGVGGEEPKQKRVVMARASPAQEIRRAASSSIFCRYTPRIAGAEGKFFLKCHDRHENHKTGLSSKDRSLNIPKLEALQRVTESISPIKPESDHAAINPEP